MANEIKTEYCFLKDLKRIVFMILSAVKIIIRLPIFQNHLR